LTDLRVIPGGRSLDAAAVAPIVTYDAELLSRVHNAERDARKVARLMAPAIAALSSGEGALAALIASADASDATTTAQAFREAAASARALAETLEQAEGRLYAAIVNVVDREMAKLPT
jgi:predicted phage-related endonuclease